MKIEPHKEDDGYKVWLSEREQQTLLDYYDEQPVRKLALWLALHGLRGDELIDVCFQDFREMDVSEERYVLRVRDGKTGYRECPVSNDLYSLAKTIKNLQSLRKDEPIVDYSKSSVRNWVQWAAEDLQEREGKHWEYVRPHDLRRTWATQTYWSIKTNRSREVVMEWGGWIDVQTFTQNYLGAIPDSVAVEVMDEAGIN
jgi:integrase